MEVPHIRLSIELKDHCKEQDLCKILLMSLKCLLLCWLFHGGKIYYRNLNEEDDQI